MTFTQSAALAFTLSTAAPPLPQQSGTTGITNTAAAACCSWLRLPSAPSERGGVAAISRSFPGAALMVGPAAELSRERGAPKVGGTWALLSPGAAALPRPDDAGRTAPAYSDWAVPDKRAWLFQGGQPAPKSPHLLPAASATTEFAAAVIDANEDAAADMPPSTSRAWVMGLEVPGRAVWPRVPVEGAGALPTLIAPAQSWSGVRREPGL